MKNMCRPGLPLVNKKISNCENYASFTTAIRPISCIVQLTIQQYNKYIQHTAQGHQKPSRPGRTVMYSWDGTKIRETIFRCL